jgi:uncharacterized membrane protein YkvI
VTAATGLNYKLILVVIMTLAIPLALQSFSALVSKIYPVLGVIGLIIIFAVFINIFRGALSPGLEK